MSVNVWARGAFEDPADGEWLWLSENMPLTKPICGALPFRPPSINPFWTLGSGLVERERRRRRMITKIAATIAAHPPTEPTTIPAMVPPPIPESSLLTCAAPPSESALEVDVESVEPDSPVVTAVGWPPLVSVATVLDPVDVVVPEASEVSYR